MTGSTPALATPRAGDYVIDPSVSSVTFDTRHVFGLGAVHGSFSEISGEIRVRDPLNASSVELSIPVVTFASGNTRRDRTVLSPRMLDPDQFPTISFRSTEVVNPEGVGGTVVGLLNAHGVDRRVNVDVQSVRHSGAAIVVNAVTTVDRFAFGVTTGRGLAARYLRLTFQIVAHP